MFKLAFLKIFILTAKKTHPPSKSKKCSEGRGSFWWNPVILFSFRFFSQDFQLLLYFRKRLFPARNHIFDHFRPNGRPFCGKSKIQKIAKKSILAKNSNACRMADIGRNDDIWPEIGLSSVLESFCTKNHHSNPNRSYFKQFWKNRFFDIFICGIWPFSGW